MTVSKIEENVVLLCHFSNFFADLSVQTCKMALKEVQETELLCVDGGGGL